MSTETIAERIRRTRLEKKLPLRKVAAKLDMDVAILSKMERGIRKLTKPIVLRLAEIYGIDRQELLILFLSQRIIEEIGEEELAIEDMQVAEDRISYTRMKPLTKKELIGKMKDFLTGDKRIKTAWLFGSYARGDQRYNSDVDVMVRFNARMKITLFDLADIAEMLGQQTGRKIDLVEEGCLQPFAWTTAQKDLIKIYG